MFHNLWQRTRTFVGRLLKRRAPAPGRFETGSKFSWRGLLGVAPWIWPRRDYLVYVPAGRAPLFFRRRPLLVLVHGCRQTAEDIAAGSRITALADALDCLVLLPKQNPRANAWGCWNWFDQRTTAGAGEVAILAAQIRAVRRHYRIHRKRVFAAGLSSGGGLVTLLSIRNSGLLSGAFVHSGIAAGVASSPMSALDVLKRGPDTDVLAIGRKAREHAGKHGHTVPMMVVQGQQDDVVAPMHATETVRQALGFARFAGVQPAPAPLPPADHEHVTQTTDGRRVTTRDWQEGSRLIARLVLVDGLGHAWSGGDPAIKFNDPHAPSATDLLQTFMADVLR